MSTVIKYILLALSSLDEYGMKLKQEKNFLY